MTFFLHLQAGSDMKVLMGIIGFVRNIVQHFHSNDLHEDFNSRKHLSLCSYLENKLIWLPFLVTILLLQPQYCLISVATSIQLLVSKIAHFLPTPLCSAS